MLSRILRNNDFIRILAICQICILIFTLPIYAIPDTQDVSGMVNRVNNFTIWSDFTTNVNAYYGDDTATYLDTVNTASYNKLQKLYDAFRSQFYTSGIYAWSYNIINHQMSGTNNSPAAKVLEAIGYNTAYLSSLAYSQSSTVNSIYSQVYSNLAKSTDISNQTTAIVNAINNIPGGSSSVSYNLNWKNRSLTASYYNTLADAVAGTNPAANGSRTKLFVKLVFDDYYPYNDALYIEFPIFPYGPLSFSNHEIYIDKAYCPNNDQSGATLLSDQNMYFYYDDFTTCSSAYIDGLGRTNNSGFYDITRRTLILEITASQYFYCVVTTPSVVKSLDFLSKDYITFIDYMHLEDMNYNLADLSTDDIVNALDNLDVNVDINDSINVTPIELDVSIGVEDFTAVNTVSNKLRTWLSTGVGVSALIAALDQLDDSFFTLHNRSVIETINNQYTDFYD